ncbi:MAG: MauE/DoxX family redox-associated membrane protein [Phormidesmis sp.]
MGFLKNIIQQNKVTLRNLLAVLIIAAGVLHFVIPQPFIKIVPGFLPYPAVLVYISGICEIALGAGLFFPATRQLAAWGLVALFIAVYPANLNMAFNHIKLSGIPDSWWFHGIRLPFQFVLIAWAYWYTGADEKDVARSLDAP